MPVADMGGFIAKLPGPSFSIATRHPPGSFAIDAREFANVAQACPTGCRGCFSSRCVGVTHDLDP